MLTSWGTENVRHSERLAEYGGKFIDMITDLCLIHCIWLVCLSPCHGQTKRYNMPCQFVKEVASLEYSVMVNITTHSATSLEKYKTALKSIDEEMRVVGDRANVFSLCMRRRGDRCESVRLTMAKQRRRRRLEEAIAPFVCWPKLMEVSRRTDRHTATTDGGNGNGGRDTGTHGGFQSRSGPWGEIPYTTTVL